MYIDSHCHLEQQTFGDELDAVIERAHAAGVSRMVAVGASRVSVGAGEAVQLAESKPSIFATAGVHPHDAGKMSDEDLAKIASYLSHPKVVSVGEIGLDYHYDYAPRDVQIRRFEQQLELAKEAALPVMLHTREAHDDTLACLDRVGLPERGGVVHCFTGDSRQAADYLDRGMLLSIPGVVTFKGKSADPLRQAVRDVIPTQRLLVETDSPYLAPHPHRGKRNEPAYVVETAAKVAELKGMSVAELGQLTARNAIEFFGLEPPEALTSLGRDRGAAPDA